MGGEHRPRVAAPRRRTTGPDYPALEACFRAVAHRSRLELLELLREPRALQDLRLSPGPSRAGKQPDRPISRQAIAEHLEKLVQVGLVHAGPADRRSRHLREYAVNPRRLYHLLEAFRRFSVEVLGPSGGGVEPAALGGTDPWAEAPGPKLVLVRGAYEGRAFPLRRDDLRGGRGWVVGRKAGLAVSLAYDPELAPEHAEVQSSGDGFAVLDLAEGRGPTRLNWRPLVPREPVSLEAGDVLGVGGSLLVFRRS